MDDTPEKLCTKCNEFWPADSEFFQPSPKYRDGLSCWCRACNADYQIARRQKLKEFDKVLTIAKPLLITTER